MSSELQTVLSASTKLESMLSSLGAHGRGLNEKCSSLGHLLPDEIVWSIRFIGRIRNKLVHEPDAKLHDLGAFQYQASSAIAYLEDLLECTAEIEDPIRPGITITIPDKVVHEIPIEELEWFSSQPVIFQEPPKKSET